MNIRHSRTVARVFPRALTATVAALLLPAISFAANKTWDGGGADNNWLTGGNWDLDIAPASNDALFFAGSGRPGPINNFTAGSLFNGITFNAGAAAFTLTGNALTLTQGISSGGGNTTGGNITNSSANAETVNVPITLGAGNHAITTAASSGQLNLAATVTRAPGSQVVFTKGGGNINLTGSGFTVDASGILGGWAVTGIGTNTGDWATLDGSGNVIAYTGYTPVAPGATLASSTTQNIRIATSGANVTTVASLTEANTVLYAGTTANQTLAINAGTTLRLGAKGAIMNTAGSAPSANHNFIVGAAAGTGILTAGGADNQAGELFLYNNTFSGTNNDTTINSVITDNGTGAVTVNVMGYVVLATANSYSGNTYINQGRIQAGNAGAFGSGSVNVAAGAEAFLNNNGTFNNNFFLTGIGATETSGGQQLGAIRMNTGGTTLSGTITLLGDSRISGGSGGNNVISGRITGTGRLEFTAATGNNGSINLNNTSANPNDWTGGLIITVGGATRQVFLKLLANEQIPDGPGKGDVTIAGTSDVARFDLNGRSETINGLISATGANHQVANLGNAGPSTLTLGNNNATATFGGVLSDAGGANTLAITKIGSGTQTLAGANTNLGLTSINAGTLAVTGTLAAAGTVNINADGSNAGTLSGTGSVGNVVLGANNGTTIPRLAPGINSVPGNVGTLTMASLTVNGGDYVVDIPGLNDAINVTGTAIFAAASTITPSSSAQNGVYTVLTAATLVLTTPPTVVQPTDTRKTFTADYSVPNAINIVVDGLSKTLNWTGATNSAWDLNTTKNWNDGTIDEKYFNGDAVNFMDGPTNRNLTIASITVSPASISVNNSPGNDYSISGTGAIGGGASLTKDGGGTLTLNTNNTYTGTTTVFAGMLQVGSGGTTGSLGTGSVNNSGTLAFNRSDATTVANAISGTGAITKSGNGVLTLSGINTYGGTTTINAGTVKVTNSNSLGTLPGGIVTIVSGATLDLGGNTTANNQNFGQKPFVVSGTGVNGNGAIINNSAVNQQNAFQRLTLAGDTTFAGPGRFDIRAVAVSGVNQASLDLAGHTLTKEGSFFFALVGVDVSDGDIVVNAGTLNLESTTTLPDLGTGRKITFNAGTNLQLFATVAPSTILRPMIFNGGGIQIGNSSAGASAVASPMTLNGDVTLTALSATPGALTLAGNITEIGGSRAITKTGNCVILLTGNNSFSGGTTVTLGTLQVGSATALGPSTAPLAVNGGTLDLFGNNLTVGAFSGTGGTITSSVPSSDLRLTAGGSGTTTFAGVIQNGAASSVGLTKQSNSNLILSGTSTYSGDTLVNAGTLTVNGTLNASTVNVNGGTLKGIGTIVAGLHLNSGTLAPGTSPGILNAGSVELNGGTFAEEIGGATAGNGTGFYDQLNVTGFVTFTAPTTLTLDFSTYDPVDGVDAFTILNNDDFDDITFFGVNPHFFYNGLELNEGAQFTAVSGAFTQNFVISYIGGTGNDVVLLAVPEPATAAMFLCGLGALAARRSRRSHLDTPPPVKGSSGREMPV